MNGTKLYSVLTLLMLALVLIGCSSGSNVATAPDLDASRHQVAGDNSNRVLWGLWDISLDPVNGTAEVTPLRTANFTANVNNLLEGQPGNLILDDMNVDDFFTEGRLDVTIELRHPLPGYDMYNGFDVWGVFMHNGSAMLDYDNLVYGDGTGDMEATLLNPDGYTRWFNYSEFDGLGPQILKYWPGKLGNLAEPSATLNPYKIFADGLDIEDDYYEWITSGDNADNRGIFSAGYSNGRRYELQFPMDGSIPVTEFQYAVIATWEPGDPTIVDPPATHEPGDFPTSANCEEAFFLHVSTADSDLYFVDSSTYGGSLVADIEVFDWQGGFGGNGVPNEVERIIMEGDFIPTGSHEFTQAELATLALPGTTNSSVFQVEIANCEPSAMGEADFWVIVEAAGLNADSYEQGFPTPYPEEASRAAYIPSTVLVTDNNPVVPAVYNLVLDIERDSNDMITGIILDWDDNAGITEYNIYRQDPFDDTDDWVLIPDSPVAASEYTDNDIVGNEAYQYQVVGLVGVTEVEDKSVQAYAILENAEDNVNTDCVWETCAFPLMYNPSSLPWSLFNEFAPLAQTPNNGVYCWDESGYQNGPGTPGNYWTGSATLFATPVLPLPDGADTCEVEFCIRLLNQWPFWDGQHAGVVVGVTNVVEDGPSNPMWPSQEYIDGLDYNLEHVHGLSNYGNYTNIDTTNDKGHGTQYPEYENPVWTWCKFACPDVFTIEDARVSFGWGAANAATGTNQGNPGTSYDDIAVLIF